MEQIVYKPKIKQYECLEMIIFSFFVLFITSEA